LKIHSPLKESSGLREGVNYRKQDHNMTTTQRERSHAMMWRRKSMMLNFGPFSMQVGIALCTRVKRSMLSICSGVIGTSFRKRRIIVQPLLKLLLLVNTMGSRMSWNKSMTGMMR
jgi:hypothetical protein